MRKYAFPHINFFKFCDFKVCIFSLKYLHTMLIIVRVYVCV